jgi:hypothetical protein
MGRTGTTTTTNELTNSNRVRTPVTMGSGPLPRVFHEEVLFCFYH